MEEKLNIKQLLKEAKTCILSSSDLQQGVRIIKKILKVDSNNFWALIYYGIAAQKTDHCGEAIKIFERASNINPDALESWKGIISCAKSLKAGNFDPKVLHSAYSNMLRLEHDKDKWVELFSVVENEFQSDIISILSSCLDEDPTSDSFKHKISCRVISLKALEDKVVGDTVLLAFKGYSKSLDFYDRPIFCQKAAMHFTELKCFDYLIDFMHYSLLLGDKIYKSKLFLAQTIVSVASHDIDKAGKIIPFISNSIKEISKNSIIMRDVDHQLIQIALGVIHYHEANYLEARESFETRCYKGNVYSTLMLLKILLKLMDYEGVIFLVSKLGKTCFKHTSDEDLHCELISCFIQALSSANDVSYLRLALKLSRKVVKNYGWRPAIIISMCRACIGLKDRRVYYYLNKLQPFSTYGDDYEFLCSLLKQKPSVFSSDSDLFALNQLHSAVLSILRSKIPKAVKTCMVAGERDNRLSDAYLVLGLYYEFNLDYTKSLVCFDKARNNRPRDDVAIRYLCNLLFRLDQSKMALNILESCRTGLFNKWHWSAEKACLVAAEVRKVRNEFQRALSNLRHAQKLKPSCNNVMEMIAGTYAEMRMLGCAENYYLRILSSDMVDLKALISLAHLRKLTLNHSEFYTNSIKCLNCLPSPNANALDFHLSFALFLSYISQFNLNMNNTNQDSFENSLKKLTVKVIKKLNTLKHQDWSSSVTEEKLLDYPVGLYFFIESHLFAAMKLAKRQEFVKASKLFRFAIMATCRLLQIHSGTCPSFWKLLGDVLIESSCIAGSICVPEWIVKPDVPTSSLSVMELSRAQRLCLAAKCYNIGLKFVSNSSKERIHEFYFDMAVTHAKLSNLPETVCPIVKNGVIRKSFEYACQSFINYPSVDSESDVWIHFNLMGALGAMMGASEEIFDSPFGNFSISVSEETRIMNRGTFYLKNGLYKEALKIYEQGRLLGDTNYSGPWVGQLVAAVVSDEIQDDVMNKLIFQLKYHGNHPLLLWICTMVLFSNMRAKEFFEEEVMLRRVLKPGLQHEGRSPSRLTVLGYCLEKIGEVQLARKAYFMALRSAKYSSEHYHYDVFISNCLRLCGRCDQYFELKNCMDTALLRSSSNATYYLKHLSLNSFDHQTYVNLLLQVKNLIESSSPFMSIHFISLILLTSHMVPTIPTLLESGQTLVSLIKNIKVLTKLSAKDLKFMFTSLSPDVQQAVLYLLENYYQMQRMKDDFRPSSKLYVTEESAKEIGTLTEFSGNKATPSLSYVTTLPSSFESAVKMVEIPEANHEIFVRKNHQYSAVFSLLRSTVFPATMPYQELFYRRRQKIAEIQEKFETDHLKSNRVTSQAVLSSPSLKVKFDTGTMVSNPDYTQAFIESHGCHVSQKKLVVLMYQCLMKGLLAVAAKYCYICLDIRCYKCLNIKQLIPIIAFLGVQLKNVKLLVKSSHIFPNEIILRKSLLLLK